MPPKRELYSRTKKIRTDKRGKRTVDLLADILEQLGYMVWMPPKAKWQSQDIFGWGDVFAIHAGYGKGGGVTDWCGDWCLVQSKTRQNFSWAEMEKKAKVLPRWVPLVLALKKDSVFTLYRFMGSQFTEVGKLEMTDKGRWIDVR